MPSFFIRQDPVEFSGRVAGVDPIVAFAPALFTFWVEPDPPHVALLTTRSGATNPGGVLACGVAIDPTLAGWDKVVQLVAAANGKRVRVVGTWCDEEESDTTAIRPLGMLAVRHEIAVYELDGWPVAVRDFDLYAFGHTSTLETAFDPHVNESQTLSMRLEFPVRPSDAATPFSRAYAKTITNHVDSLSLTVDESGALAQLEVAIETGSPGSGKGFYAAQVGLTFEEPDLAQYCPPGVCDLEGHHCAYEGDSRFTRVPEQVPYAQKGDLTLSPGDGVGFISGIVASLEPPQVYDHMGMFVDHGRTIRHCTSSMDRIEDDSLFTSEISIKLAGVITLEKTKVPLNGFRPDLVRFGWPGSITQTVEEVYRTGRNSLNPRWAFANVNPGQDTEDPERPGEPFRLYHLPRAERQRRVEFADPERRANDSLSKTERIVRLQDTSVHIGEPAKEYKALLVRPHPQFELLVRDALKLVAESAKRIDAHYRFFAYTRGDIGLDPSFEAPVAGDGAWSGLPQGADWAAGTIGAMCSSFVWTAVQRANERFEADSRPLILLEDRLDQEDPNLGLEYGSLDGFYLYQAAERNKAGTKLVAKIEKKIRDRFDDQIPDVAYGLLPELLLFREVTAANVSKQIANAFASDGCEVFDDSWESPTNGDTASPDNTLFFWDLKAHVGRLVQPEGKIAVYGDSVPIQLTPPRWRRVPLYRKQETDLGTGEVTGIARIAGTPIAGATIRFDFGCVTATTTDNREEAFRVQLGTGTHFAEGFIVLPNPVSQNLETFRTTRPLKFDVHQGQLARIELDLEPPPELWRIVDVHLDADVHDRSFWGGDADARVFHIDRSFELRQDLEDEPDAPEDQRNSVLHHADVWRTEPEVGSGVHVAVSYIADLDPSDRSVRCHCEVALLDTDSGGFLGIGTSSDVDQLEVRDVVIPEDQSVDVLRDVDFSSNESVPERARVSLILTNRRRPS